MRKKMLLIILQLCCLAGMAQDIRDLYPVKLRGLWGYIDITGEMVIPTLFTGAYPEAYKTVNIVKDSSGFFLADNTGKPVIAERYSNYYWNNGAGLLTFCDKKNRWGCIDTTGKIIVPFEQTEPFDFRDGIAAVIQKDQTQGYYNTRGDFFHLRGLDALKNIGEGILAARQGKYWGLYDTRKQQWIKRPSFLAVYTAKYGHAIVTDTLYRSMGILALASGTYSLPPRKGQFILTSEPNAESVFFRPDDLYFVRVKGRAYVTGPDGKKAFDLPKKYRNFSVLGFYNGFSTVYKEKSSGLINKKGELVIEPVYLAFRQFSEGRIPAQDTKGFWGITDSTGVQVVPCRYSDASPLINGLAMITENGSLQDIYNPDAGCKLGYVNKNGTVVWRPSR